MFEDYPELAELRDELQRRGATVARLTGSGAALFGVFDSDESATRCASSLDGAAGVAEALQAETLDRAPINPIRSTDTT